MRENKKYCVRQIVEKYRNKAKRPQNVEKQIERFWKAKTPQERERIYEYVQLERIISEYGKI